MKRKSRALALLLAATLLCALVPAAGATDAVTPTPPEWVPAENYLVFPGDEVYQPENWAKVLELREDARNGGQLPAEGMDWAEGSPGMRYETALARLRYSENAEGSAGRKAFYSAGRAFAAAASAWLDQNHKEKDEHYYRLSLLTDQYYMLFNYNYADPYANSVHESLTYLGLPLDYFFNGPYMDQLPAADRDRLVQEMDDYLNAVGLYLDGGLLSGFYYGDPVEVKDGRVMIPIRLLAEQLGADVEWLPDTQGIRMTRAGVVVTMTIGETTATIDGTPMEMDVAPYAVNGRTLIPARFVGEFFGQKVTWDGAERRVDVVEDKSVAGDSNLEAWAIAMGAMRGYMDDQNPGPFGQRSRSAHSGQDAIAVYFRSRLLSDWSIANREDLIDTVLRMTDHGHNDAFLEAAGVAKGLSDAQMSQLIAQSSATDQYMWPYTRSLAQKWGDKGIMAWDLFRMSNLVQWGYTAGYLTYAEALALVEPAAVRLSQNFSSWNEAYENYLDGYNWWARNDMTGKDLWTDYRGGLCKRLLDKYTQLFDDSLFKTGVIPVPGVTADDLAKEIR